MICTIVGARPQFVKAAVVSRALAEAGAEEVIVHTGQHYDPSLSRVFFDELGIAEPAIDLEVGSASHAVQTGEIMIRLERFLLEGPPPEHILVYGDTNSTIAGALVAAKLHLPLAHVEAGLRSFNRRMPEEINRVVTDRLSDLLFCPTETSVSNLNREGISRGVHLTGDVMLDATRFFAGRAAELRPVEDITGHEAGSYYLATVHRAENTDDPARLAGIFEGFGHLQGPVLLPLHPRTKALLGSVNVPANVEIIEPASYLTMLTLVRSAHAVLTDSGGIQKEAVWLGVPVVTLRDETEWVETMAGGWNQVVGADPDRIVEAALQLPEGDAPAAGKTGAAASIARILTAG